MRPKDFKRWRKSLGLSQKAAAETLGLKRRVVQYYEKGERDGKDVEIPKCVRLACYAISEGVSDYHGPRDTSDRTEPALRLVSKAEHSDKAAARESAPGVEEDDEPSKKDKKRAKGEKEEGREKGKTRDRGKDKDKEKKKEKEQAESKAAGVDDL